MKLGIPILAILLQTVSVATGPAIRGVVLEAQSDRPIEGVTLYFYEGDACGVMDRITSPDCQVNLARRTSTDSQGRFHLPGVRSGAIRARAVRAGYSQVRPDRPDNPAWLVPLTVPEDRFLDNVVLRMIPNGVVTGRIFDFDGLPASKVQVSLAQYRYDDLGNRVPELTRGVQTNDLGEFRMTAAVPGEYFVVVEPGLFLLGGEAGVFSTTYYPGTGEPGRAVPVLVEPGTELRLDDIRLLPASGRTARLRIRDVTGAGSPEMRVMQIRSGSTAMAMQLDTAATGGADVFEIPGLWPGTHEFTLGWPTSNGRVAGRAILEVGDADIDGEIVVAPPVRIAGRVTKVAGGNDLVPVAGVRTILYSDGIGSSQSGVSDADGMFAISNVTPGRFRLRFSGLPGDAYIVSANGAAGAMMRDIEVSDDTTLDVRLSAGAGSVAGHVRDDAGRLVVDAVVALVPESPLSDHPFRYHHTATDQHGHYILAGVAPGSYRAFAWSGPPASALETSISR